MQRQRRRKYTTSYLSLLVVVFCCSLAIYSAILYKGNINITQPAYWTQESSISANRNYSVMSDNNIVPETMDESRSPSEQSLGGNTQTERFATVLNVKTIRTKDQPRTTTEITTPKTQNRKSTLVPNPFTSDHLHKPTVKRHTTKFKVNDEQRNKANTTELHTTIALSISNLFTTSYVGTQNESPQEINTAKQRITNNHAITASKYLATSTLLSTVKVPDTISKYSSTTKPSYIKIDTTGFIMKLNSSLQLLQPQQQANLSVCSPYYGGLGNQMFQFAASFGVAASKNMSLIIPKSHEVVKFFDIDEEYVFDDDACENFTGRQDSIPCSFDPKLSNFDGNSNYKIGSYLQSWMYFFESANALRNQFVFKEHIRNQTQDVIEPLLLKHNFTSRNNVTLVGVHIRRGNMVNHTLGYTVATEEYLQKAVRHFSLKYVSNIIFLVCSDDMEWSKENMPYNHTIEYISGHKPEIDMSILGSCDHLISTVGSFSWWSAWLTGGEVTYFKWPAAEGSPLRRHYSEDFFDYFYPGWIGI